MEHKGVADPADGYRLLGGPISREGNRPTRRDDHTGKGYFRRRGKPDRVTSPMAWCSGFLLKDVLFAILPHLSL